jgi:DNA-binding SARP family transcriptional activator/tetratricopeptide (TPR) repeat protein/DNA-binding XRE family transcriptional regulator
MGKDGGVSGWGGRLRELRRAAGLSQREVALLAGLGVRALRDIERDRVARPRESTLEALVEVLGAAGAEYAQELDPPDRASTPAARPVGIDVLGPLRVRRGEAAVAVTSPALRTLLGLLAIQPGQPVVREQIVDVLWGQRPPRTCLTMLHGYVARLRGLLEPERSRREEASVVMLAGTGYRLNPDRVRVDVTRFDAAMDRVARARCAGEPDAAMRWLDRALACWRGSVLSGAAHALRQHPAVVATARRRVNAVLAYADVAIDLRRYEPAVCRLQLLLPDEPLHEALVARLMLALAGCGQQAAALDLYTTSRTRLAEELGIEPGPALRDAHLTVLRGQLPVAALTGGRPVPPAPPAQLPPDVPGFAGRAEPLARLDRLLAGAGRPDTVVISAVSGTAGVGKTALAVHWAYRAAARFPDGQLYVNLRGFDPGGRAVTQEEALRGFLDSLGIPAQRVPRDFSAQVGLYRSLLAQRRVLVVLDNARDAEHARPLLPGAPGCLAVVTSRDRLDGLVVAEGAYALRLDLLMAEESRQLLAGRVGTDRIAADPAATAQIIERCAGLPLALAVVAAHAAAQPGHALTELASQLHDARAALDALASGDAATDVRAVLSWSYRALSPHAARLFRLLGVHPGADIGALAVASLAGVPVAEARALLAELTRAHLLHEPAAGRYAFHDLLRAYAAEQVDRQDTGADRRAAAYRALDHYVHAGHTAAELLNPERDPLALPPPQPGVAAVPLTDEGQAIAWFRAERPVLLALVRYAAVERFDAHAWQLAWAAADFLDRQGHWNDAVGTHRIASEAAARLGDRVAQASVHRDLARAYGQQGCFDKAQAHLRQALAINTTLADPVALGDTYGNMVAVYSWQGRYRDALVSGQESLRHYRAAGYLRGEAMVLNNVGWTYAQLGDHARAMAHCEQAIALLRRSGNRMGEGATCDSIGYIHHELGNFDEALVWYQRAIGIYREVGERRGEAITLSHVGDTHHAAGDTGAATGAWRQALAILRYLNHPYAEQVCARLVGAGQPVPAP